MKKATPALSQLLMVASASFLLSPSVMAAPHVGNQFSTNTRFDSPAGAPGLVLAQRTVNNCREGESMFLAIETKNFWVNICGGDEPYTYVGMDKSTRKSIRLPLSDYDSQGTYFEAVNRDYTYILAQTPKGKFLTVTQGTRELLREPVLRGW